MNFSERITFVKETESYYDPEKGEYVDGELIKTVRPCNLSSMGVDRTNQLFGQIDTVITVARLQRPYNDRVDYVHLNEKENEESPKYQVKRQSDYRKGVFYLEGVKNG
jgi:hypothetical protein